MLLSASWISAVLYAWGPRVTELSNQNTKSNRKHTRLDSKVAATPAAADPSISVYPDSSDSFQLIAPKGKGSHTNVVATNRHHTCVSHTSAGTLHVSAAIRLVRTLRSESMASDPPAGQAWSSSGVSPHQKESSPQPRDRNVPPHACVARANAATCARACFMRWVSACN